MTYWRVLAVFGGTRWRYGFYPGETASDAVLAMARACAPTEAKILSVRRAVKGED